MEQLLRYIKRKLEGQHRNKSLIQNKVCYLLYIYYPVKIKNIIIDSTKLVIPAYAFWQKIQNINHKIYTQNFFSLSSNFL